MVLLCITLHYMSRTSSSVPRSFRLSHATSELLDRASESASESRNALADRLLGEALRTERHPWVRFRTGSAGRREPSLVGTRLLVRQVVATVREHDQQPEAAAEYLGISPSLVRAAVAYYADFRTEVDADARWAERVEADEYQRWERQQSALA